MQQAAARVSGCLMKRDTDDCSLFRSCHLADAITSPVLKIHAMASSLQTKKSNRNGKWESFFDFKLNFHSRLTGGNIGRPIFGHHPSGGVR